MASIVLWISLLLSPAWLNHPGKHFSIHYRGSDKMVVKEVERKLEDNYYRLINLFEVDFDKRIEVYIHPNLYSLKSTMNIDDPSEWLVGLAVGDKTIHIVSPANPPGNHSYDSVMEGLIHELVHICVARSSKTQLPVWLNEGLAVYYSGQQRFAQEVPGLVMNLKEMPGLFILSDHKRFAQRNGYSLSYTIIEMVEKFVGHGGISRWVKEYPDHSALGLDNLSELEDMWHTHLENKYQNPQAIEGWSEFAVNTFDVRLEPNPIKDFGDIEFVIPERGRLTVDVLDPWGNKIQNLISRNVDAGIQGFRIDARDFPPGIYYLELRSGGQRQLIRFTH